MILNTAKQHPYMDIMSKRIVTAIILMLIAILPSSAVLKEKNLESSLSVLRSELTSQHNELELQSDFMVEQQKNIVKNIMDIFNQSAQNSLMLYSQKQDYIFNLTYACHEATEMYKKFQTSSQPFRNYIETNAHDIARYDSLISYLNQIPHR